MEALVYITRATIMLLVAWFALRIIGKKSIAQMTSYELAGVMLLTTVAAEPLVFKVVSKASLGTLFIALLVVIIGSLSLRKSLYNLDMKPDIIIQNGKVNRDVLKRNQMNLPLLLSMLRLKGYAKLSDVEFALIEPNGQISALPKAGCRPVQPNDMQLQPENEGLPLPVIIDGEIQYNNLSYAHLTTEWLKTQLTQANIQNPEDVFVAQLTAQNKLYFTLYQEANPAPPSMN